MKYRIKIITQNDKVFKTGWTDYDEGEASREEIVNLLSNPQYLQIENSSLETEISETIFFNQEMLGKCILILEEKE